MEHAEAPFGGKGNLAQHDKSTDSARGLETPWPTLSWPRLEGSREPRPVSSLGARFKRLRRHRHQMLVSASSGARMAGARGGVTADYWLEGLWGEDRLTGCKWLRRLHSTQNMRADGQSQAHLATLQRRKAALCHRSVNVVTTQPAAPPMPLEA